ncbi:MAG TPA: PEP/pyruvate-binding domain-containing protein, partial [Anaerolineales bacterium]
VAVRSSATAEDLPDVSFAGQQDTFLNVIGEEQILSAVIACWSSLWTARAIGYRLRNHIDQEDVALAVAVQEMVQSDVSGVMFTANPLTGLRSETVMDATLGLGEALVSGQVEPDHYVINTLSDEIVSRTAGAKSISTRGRAGGGVETVSEQAAGQLALSDEQVRALAQLGTRVEQEYGFPQDIEWAYSGGELYVLQARPITSLFPIPEESYDPLKVWFSFGSIQGLLGPMTPLGQDCVRLLLTGAGRMLGIKADYEHLDVFALAGERIWVRMDGVVRNPVGVRFYRTMLPMVEPSVAQILDSLASEPGLKAGQGKLKPGTVWRLALFMLWLLPWIISSLWNPERARLRADEMLEDFSSQARFSPTTDMYARLAELVAFLRDRTIVHAFQLVIPRIIPLLGPSIASLRLLTELAGAEDASHHGVSPLVLEVTRGLPHNVTTEMDLALWETAQDIRRDPESARRFASGSAPELAQMYLHGSLPGAAQRAVARFMERYGMRGVGEIDLGNPRWREQPEPIMQTLLSYLQITDENLAPDVLFANGARAAEAAIDTLAERARSQPVGWLKEKLVRGAGRRVRALMGSRESPKFYAIKVMGLARQELLEVGQQFVTAGIIDQPDDLCFLYVSELDALSKREPRAWRALIASRRLDFDREARRRQVPRVLVSDGRAIYEGFGSETEAADVITGSPVSPGVVEGVVHVVFDPQEARLMPGEILVCPGTDPAWTPLFMAAGGLVTEVGGMMTHGSVVAREYGIPAVVGVHDATRRLKDGQKIRLDGSAGKITLMDAA